MQLQFKLSINPTGGSPVNEIVTATVCKFGYVVNNIPSEMNGNAIDDTSITFDSHIVLIENTGSGIGEVNHYSGDSAIVTSWDYSPSQVSGCITTQFKQNTKTYQLDVDSIVPFDGCQAILKMRINEPCYRFESKAVTFRLTMYLNFYTTEDPQGASYFMAPKGLSVNFYCNQQQLSNYTYRLEKDTSKGPIPYYYVTFKVNVSNGHNTISWVRKNYPDQLSAIIVGSDSPNTELPP